MKSFFAFSSLLALSTLLVVQVVGDDGKHSMCGPTTLAIPHFCYTKTVTTSPPRGACPTYNCPLKPDCIVAVTETIMLPGSDPCCFPTPTTTARGTCGTCQTGCRTDTVTAFVMETPVAELAKKQAFVTACTTILDIIKPLTFGPTKTIFTKTTTQTLQVNCGGCVLATENIGGIGPVVHFTTTIHAMVPTTTNTYICTDH